MKKLLNYIRTKIDQRRNYRRFSAWLDEQRDYAQAVHELERIEELERHPAIRGR